MNKKQRKQRAAAIRRNQKLARKAGRDAPSTELGAGDAPQGSEPVERVMPGGPESLAHRGTSGQAEIETRRAETLRQDSGQAGSEGTGQTTRRRISDSRARAMLEDAAEFLNELVVMTRDALKGVAPERVAAAMEVVEAKSEPGSGTPQQQPRRGSDPLVTMIKQGISASNLLKRIISTLYPKLAKIEVPALV